jgi:hypothetical protein
MELFRFIDAAHTANFSLTEVIACLTSRPELESLLLMGSTAQPTFSPASDYDLLAVMSSMPVPLGLVHTSIDHRLAEIYSIPATALEPILQRATQSVPAVLYRKTVIRLHSIPGCKLARLSLTARTV